MMFIILALTGCGHDHNNVASTFVTQILSDPAFDGDILQTSRERIDFSEQQQGGNIST